MAQSDARVGISTTPSTPLRDIEVYTANAGGDTSHGGVIPGGRVLSGDLAVRRILH